MDPFSARTGKGLAHIYYYARKYDEALDQSKRTLELHPGYHLIFLGPIYEAKGMYDLAIDGYLQTEQQQGLRSKDLAALRQAYATTGWRGYWQKRLELLQAEAKQRAFPSLLFAELYARVGDKDKAFEGLERSYQEHDMLLILIKVDPVWDDLRSDPRFGNLLHRMGLG
jgi:tetratricopeptide (TPR) repeat protein